MSVEAVFEIIKERVPIFQALLQTSNALQNELFIALPQINRDLQDCLTTELARQSDIVNTYAYSQGVCNAMRMHQRLPVSNINTTACEHMKISLLNGNTTYKQCEQRVKHVLFQIEEKHPTRFNLAIACCNATNAADSLHAKYCYLWGIEFGIYLCKSADPGYVEDEQYINGVYNCLLDDNAPLIRGIDNTTL